MSSGMIFQTALEIIAVGFVIWGLFNEDKLVCFEDRIKACFRRRMLKVVKNGRTYNKKHCA